MRKYSILALALLGVLVIGLVVYEIVSNETDTHENSLLNDYDNYMKHNEYENLEYHPDEEYVYSLYEKSSDSTIGLVEFQNRREVKSEEIKQGESDFYVILLKGKYNNYVGVKFEKEPQKVGYIELVSKEGKKEKYVVNSNKEKSYTISYIARTKLDPNNIQTIKVFTKNGEGLYQEDI